jgi:hypothetical protein
VKLCEEKTNRRHRRERWSLFQSERVLSKLVSAFVFIVSTGKLYSNKTASCSAPQFLHTATFEDCNTW